MKAIIFDLDGTLLDSVYLHTTCWMESLAEVGLQVPAYEIHRYIGISGKLLVRALARPRQMAFGEKDIEGLEARHAALMRERASLQVPLPGAVQLLAFLRKHRISHGIATTGKRTEISSALQSLGAQDLVVVDGDTTPSAKPEPDLFLTCQEQLGASKDDCVIIGDAVWDLHAARRAGIAAVAVLTGGLSKQELFNAGAMRVYKDPAEVLLSIDEFGFDLDHADI